MRGTVAWLIRHDLFGRTAGADAWAASTDRSSCRGTSCGGSFALFSAAHAISFTGDFAPPSMWLICHPPGPPCEVALDRGSSAGPLAHRLAMATSASCTNATPAFCFCRSKLSKINDAVDHQQPVFGHGTFLQRHAEIFAPSSLQSDTQTRARATQATSLLLLSKTAALARN